MSRHDARIAAVRAVYCGDHIKGTPTNESLLFDGLTLDADDKFFYEQLVGNMGSHIDEIVSLIQRQYKELESRKNLKSRHGDFKRCRLRNII